MRQRDVGVDAPEFGTDDARRCDEKHVSAARAFAPALRPPSQEVQPKKIYSISTDFVAVKDIVSKLQIVVRNREGLCQPLE